MDTLRSLVGEHLRKSAGCSRENLTLDSSGGDQMHLQGDIKKYTKRASIMTNEDELWDLEERFWTEGSDSARHMTAKDAIFVFPYPAGILQGDSLWRESDVAQRWRSVVMSERCVRQERDVAVLAYRVSAERSDIALYEAFCTSSYLHDDGNWLRIVHQQTPVA